MISTDFQNSTFQFILVCSKYFPSIQIISLTLIMLADELQLLFTKTRAILHVRRTSKGVTIATKTRQSNITQSHRLMNIEFWSMSMILGVISCRMISTSEINAGRSLNIRTYYIVYWYVIWHDMNTFSNDILLNFEILRPAKTKKIMFCIFIFHQKTQSN